MAKQSNNLSVASNIAPPRVRQLRQSKRRGLAITVNLVADGIVSHVTLENVSATGMGLRGWAQLSCARDVQIQLADGRLLAATVCWVGNGRLGVKLVERLHQDDPLLQSDGPAQVKAARGTSGIPIQFGARGRQATDRSILVGDGFRSICLLIKGVLDKAGYNVDFVENGLALVQAASRKTYDVVLIDSHLPLMSGDVAAARLRKLPGPFGDCSIIAVSAETLDPRHFRTNNSIVDAYLAKPIHPTRLLEQVAAVIARRELEQPSAFEQYRMKAANAA
jgi:CheY-like chemotaxis protein